MRDRVGARGRVGVSARDRVRARARIGVGVGVGVGVRVGVRAGVGGLGEDLVRVLVGAGYEEVWVAEDRLDRHLVELGVG